MFAIALQRVATLKRGGKKKIKSPCLGDGEVIYSQRRCVLYRKKSTGEVMAETHRSSERHVQCKTSQSACNCLALTYTNVHVGRRVRVCPGLYKA